MRSTKAISNTQFLGCQGVNNILFFEFYISASMIALLVSNGHGDNDVEIIFGFQKEKVMLMLLAR